MDTKKLDKVFSEYTRRKDADEYGRVKCCTCSTKSHWAEMDNGHFIPRQHMATRWLEMNCHAQCKECNQLKSGNLKQYEQFLREMYGPDTVRILTDLSRTTVKFTQRELNDLVKEYKLKIKNLEQ